MMDAMNITSMKDGSASTGGIAPGISKGANKLRLLTAALILAAMAALMALAPSPAFAHVGNYWHDGPNYLNADVDMKITTWRVPGTSYGNIVVNNSYGRYPMYVQVRPVFDSNVYNDGFWKKIGGNTSAGRTSTLSWSDTTSGRNNAFEFRLCRDVSWGSDTCGSSGSIRP